MVQSQPVQAVENGLHRLGGGTLQIGVLDAEDEIALRVSRLQITEQCRARAADVQEAGGAGCKTGSHHAVSLELPFMGAKKAASGEAAL
jgi:hypothetical protein